MISRMHRMVAHFASVSKSGLRPPDHYVLRFPEPPIGFEPRYALLVRSPTVYEPQGAVNVFKRLGWLMTNRVRWNVLRI